jgi:cell shape-determining protein MreD
MRNIIAIPLLALAVILQSTLVSQFSLLAGYADLILVILAAWALQKGVTTGIQWAFLASIMISAISHMPWAITLVGYIGVVLLAALLQNRIWQAPLLAMFSVTFLGTLFMHLLSFAYLSFIGDPLPLGTSLGLITLPSLLLNLLLAIPLYGLMRDLAGWVFPVREEA